jgi:hypothetical protein
MGLTIPVTCEYEVAVTDHDELGSFRRTAKHVWPTKRKVEGTRCNTNRSDKT